MNKYRVIYLDAFSRDKFYGNPCAVLPKADGLSTEQMQFIARETNLPETAFVLSSEKADFRVRYFMPRMEIPFAGHPTIATAFMLAEEGMVKLTQPVTRLEIEFEIGILPVFIEVKDGKPVNAEMVQKKPVFGKTIDKKTAATCFNLGVDDICSGADPQVVGTGVEFLIVPIKDMSVLKNVKANRDLLANTLDELGVSAAFLCSKGGLDEDMDIFSRLIDPRGTFEDPFTGSAAGAMGCYMYHNGFISTKTIRLGQGDLLGRPGRGTLVLEGTPDDISEVRLKGPAVKVMEGDFLI